MKSIDEILKDDRVTKVIERGIDGAMFEVRLSHRLYTVIASFGGDWDHVSINPAAGAYTPTWKVMSELKDMCFPEDEMAIEYHPKKADYVNIAEHCLHLWRPQKEKVPVPPKIFI